MANYPNKQKYRLDLSRPLTWQEGDENEMYPNQWDITREYKQGQVVLYDDSYGPIGATTYGNLSFFQAKLDVPVGASSPGLRLGSTADPQPNNPYWERVGQVDDITGIGPAGPSGAVGAQGEAGPQGDPGIAGLIGAQGAQGDPGAPSTVAGPQGEQGDTGPQGNPGVIGPSSTVPGPQGAQGEEGPASTVAGPQGPTGPGGTGGVVNRSVGTLKLNIDQASSGTTADGYFPFGIASDETRIELHDSLLKAMVYQPNPEVINNIWATVCGATWQSGYSSIIQLIKYSGGATSLVNQWTYSPMSNINPGESFSLTGSITIDPFCAYAFRVENNGFTNATSNPTLQIVGTGEIYGQTGAQGVTGAQGEAGPQGTGLQGDPGPTGSTGVTGPAATYGAAANMMATFTGAGGTNQNIISGAGATVAWDTEIYSTPGVIDGATESSSSLGTVITSFGLTGGTGSMYYIEYSLGLEEVDPDTTFRCEIEYQIGQTGAWAPLSGSRIDWNNGATMTVNDTLTQSALYDVVDYADNIRVQLTNTGAGAIRLRPFSTSINIFRLQGLRGATGAQGISGTAGIAGITGQTGAQGPGGTCAMQNVLLSETVYASWDTAVGVDKLYFPIFGDGSGNFTPTLNNADNHLQYFPADAAFTDIHFNLLYAANIPSFVGTSSWDLELIEFAGLTGGTGTVIKTLPVTNPVLDPGDSVMVGNGADLTLSAGNRYCWAYANHSGPAAGDGWGFSLIAKTAGFGGETGPQGPIGPQGEAGPSSTVPGPQGEPGPAGGPIGPQGASGIDGADGKDGANSGRWKFDSSTISPSAPNIQDFITNDTNISLVSKISINKQSLSGATYDYGGWQQGINTAINNGSPVTLQLFEVATSNVVGIFTVTSVTINTLYCDLDVTNIVANGNLSNNVDYSISWVSQGAPGLVGATGAQGPGGTGGVITREVGEIGFRNGVTPTGTTLYYPFASTSFETAYQNGTTSGNEDQIWLYYEAPEEVNNFAFNCIGSGTAKFGAGTVFRLMHWAGSTGNPTPTAVWTHTFGTTTISPGDSIVLLAPDLQLPAGRYAWEAVFQPDAPNNFIFNITTQTSVMGAEGPAGAQGENFEFYFAPTAPTGSLTPGSFWYDSITGVGYFWVDDGTSSQWATPIGPGGPTGNTGLQGPTGAQGESPFPSQTPVNLGVFGSSIFVNTVTTNYTNGYNNYGNCVGPEATIDLRAGGTALPLGAYGTIRLSLSGAGIGTGATISMHSNGATAYVVGNGEGQIIIPTGQTHNVINWYNDIDGTWITYGLNYTD